MCDNYVNVVFEELGLLKDMWGSRKSELWWKLKNSTYKVPILIVVFLLFCAGSFVSWVALLQFDVEEKQVVEPEYVLFYEFPSMYEGDLLAVTYNVEDNLPITLYIFDSEAWSAYSVGEPSSKSYIRADKSSGDITYNIPGDDNYYVVFESWNDDSVTVDVRINNETFILYGYLCYFPVTLMLFILLAFLLIPQELMLKSESRIFQFDYYNIDKSFYGNILFGFGWLFGLVSVIMIALYIQSIFVSDSAIRSFYLFIVLTLTISSSRICFRYSESYGYKNPWKVFLN